MENNNPETQEKEVKEVNEEVKNEEDKSEETKEDGIDYSKLEKIIEKNTAKKENAVLKSYFAQQGLSEEEVNEAVKNYKASREAKKNDDVEQSSKISAENSQLKQQLLSIQMESKAKDIAADLGVDKKAVPYLIKMANMDSVIVDGAINDEKLTESLKDVIDAIPSLKKATGKSSGFQMGADNDKKDEENKETNADLRKALGLKIK